MGCTWPSLLLHLFYDFSRIRRFREQKWQLSNFVLAGTPGLQGHVCRQFLSKVVFYPFSSVTSYGFWHERRRYIVVIIKQIFKYFFIYFNLGDDKGEPHTLGELFLSLKSNGDTNPALFELCHTRDFRAISWCTGVPIFLDILNL